MGCGHRVFERAIVAVNWETQDTKNLAVQSLVANALGKDPQDFPFFFDVFAIPTATIIDVNMNAGAVAIPAYVGRVYLFGSSTDYGLNRSTH